MNVVFVAPYFLPATLRFVHSVAKLQGIQLGLISTNHPNHLPPELLQRIAHVQQIGNCMDPGQLALAVRELSKRMGPVQRLFGALEDLQVPLGRVRDYLGIPGLSAEAANNFRDKSRMKDVLRANGIPCARHCLVTDPSKARTFVEEVGFPIVVKPPAGAGARSTFQVNNINELKDYLAAFSPDQQRPTLFEEFIQGQEHSFEAVNIGQQRVWHSLTRYYPTPLEVLKNPWIQWCILLPREIDTAEFDDIRQVNDAALKALGATTGLTHMEWFRRKDGSLAISEVATRPPGAQIVSLMSYSHEKNFFDAWSELMVFERFTPPTREYASGVAFLRGMGNGRVKTVHGLDQAQREVGDVVMEACLPKPGQPRSTSYEGEGYVIVRHKETEVVKKALQRLISLIRVTYE